ncbi:hypothetical protein Hanom_Chr00s000001g01594871 [Helianthus anomalus]
MMFSKSLKWVWCWVDLFEERGLVVPEKAPFNLPKLLLFGSPKFSRLEVLN